MCVCVCTLKGTVASSFSCWDSQYKGSKGAMHCMLCMSTLSRQKIKACNVFNAIYVDTVNTKQIHTFLPITFLIFSQFSIWKSFRNLRLRAFQPYHQILYMLILSIQDIRIPYAFNAIYVDAVNTKHIHTFLPITFIIFNQFSIRKKFWKAETKGLSTIPLNTICQYCQYKT